MGGQIVQGLAKGHDKFKISVRNKTKNQTRKDHIAYLLLSSIHLSTKHDDDWLVEGGIMSRSFGRQIGQWRQKQRVADPLHALPHRLLLLLAF